MSRIMEEFAKEERKEAKIEERMNLAAKVLESGKMTEEEIVEMFKLTEKQLQIIKEKITVLV